MYSKIVVGLVLGDFELAGEEFHFYCHGGTYSPEGLRDIEKGALTHETMTMAGVNPFFARFTKGDTSLACTI